jgi:hypothetical protein
MLIMRRPPEKWTLTVTQSRRGEGYRRINHLGAHVDEVVAGAVLIASHTSDAFAHAGC